MKHTTVVTQTYKVDIEVIDGLYDAVLECEDEIVNKAILKYHRDLDSRVHLGDEVTYEFSVTEPQYHADNQYHAFTMGAPRNHVCARAEVTVFGMNTRF